MANNELDAAIANLTLVQRQTDLVLHGTDYPVTVLINGIADEIAVLVAAEQGAGDLASLTTAMGALVTTMRLKAATICALIED